MIFFKGMNSAMKRKIYEHSVFSESHENLIALTKKLQLNIEDEIIIKTADSNITVTSNMNSSLKCKNQKSVKKLFIKFSEITTLWEKFNDDCHYCRKYKHHKMNCLKKKSDNFTEKSQISSQTTNSNWVVNVTDFCELRRGSAKPKKNKRMSDLNDWRLWLAVHLAEKSLQTVLNSVSDLNLIYKNLTESIISVFKVPSFQHTDSQLLQTYFIYHEKVKVENSFRDWKQTHKPFISADLKMSLILELSWLQWNNLKVDFINLTVQWNSAVNVNQLFTDTEEIIWNSLTKKLRNLQMNYIVQNL